MVFSTLLFWRRERGIGFRLYVWLVLRRPSGSQIDDEQLFLTGAFPLNSIQLGDSHFLLVGHRHKYHYPAYQNDNIKYHGDGINIFVGALFCNA